MKKTWTWILGILLVLVILGGLGAAGYYWGSSVRRANHQGIPGPSLRADRYGWHSGPLMRGGRFEQGSSLDSFAYRSFSPFNMLYLIGGLRRLVLLGLLLYGAYWLGKRKAQVVVNPQASSRGEESEPRTDDAPPTSA